MPILRPGEISGTSDAHTRAGGRVCHKTCGCEPAKAVRRRQSEAETIQDLFAECPLTVLDLLQQVVDLLREGLLASGTSIKLEENITAKFKVKDGAVIITRSEKHQHQTSI